MTPAGIIVRVEFSIVYLAVAYHAWKVFGVPWREELAGANVKSACVAFARNIIGWLVECLRNLVQRQAGPIDRAIQELMQDFRMEQSRKCATVLANFFGPALLAFVILREIDPDAPPSKEMVATSYGFLTFGYVSALLVSSDWIRLTTFKVDIIFAFVCCAALTRVILMTDDPQFFTENSIRQLLQLSAAVVYMDFRKAIPWHVAWAVVNCWRFHHNASAIRHHKDPQDAAFYFALRELWVCGIIILGSSVVEKWLEGRFRVQITTQNQKRAMMKLASYRCDAVFWLTPDLRLFGPAPQLAEMLFLGNVRNRLDGRQFENYIANDTDRERFRDFIAHSTASSEPEGLPSLLHLGLRDSTSRTFQVEVLHSCFMDINNQAGHFIGISEEREVEQQPAVAPEGNPPTAILPPVLREEPALDVASVHSASSATQSMASDSVPSLMPIISEHTVQEPVAILIDAITDEILGCTAGFTSLTGPLAYKTSIVDMTVDSREYLVWFQHEANSFRERPDREFQQFDLRLSSRTSRNGKVEVQSKACITKIKENTSVAEMELGLPYEDEIYGMLCVIALRDADIEWVDRTKKKKKKPKLPNEHEANTFHL